MPLSRFWNHWTKEDVVLICAGALGLVVSFFTLIKSRRLIGTLAPQIDITGLLRTQYTKDDFHAVWNFLTQKGVLIFKSLPNGLFSAAGSAEVKDVSGYQNVWVRDNVHVAHAHYVCGDKASAVRAMLALMKYFQKYHHRFTAIINDQEPDRKKALAADPMNRPHIRFDGREMKELDQKWGHAQNDALGYFLWCYCKLVLAGDIHPGSDELKCLSYFPQYFEAIQYWQDEDSGHWEEMRKVSASSIGTVVAGLREFGKLMKEKEGCAKEIKPDFNRLSHLCEKGEEALRMILPCESISPEKYYRRYDGALLFLIYPLEILKEGDAEIILEDVQTHLQGDYGIRRYLGDSYWFPNYKKKIRGWKRTGDFSGSMEERDVHVRLGEEAQWCIFDPILSVIYGQMHLLRKQQGLHKEANHFLQLQTAYFNRSLNQLAVIRVNGVDQLRAPEAYYLEDGHYVPNDHTPLLWTQANLWLAAHQMRQSV